MPRHSPTPWPIVPKIWMSDYVMDICQSAKFYKDCFRISSPHTCDFTPLFFVFWVLYVVYSRDVWMDFDIPYVNRCFSTNECAFWGSKSNSQYLDSTLCVKPPFVISVYVYSYVSVVLSVGCCIYSGEIGRTASLRTSQPSFEFDVHVVYINCQYSHDDHSDCIHVCRERPFTCTGRDTFPRMICFGWGKGGKVTAARWQVTLCDPVLYAIFHSCVVIFDYKLKGKVFPYSLLSVGFRANPSVQAVSPQLTFKVIPSGRLPLCSTSLAFTFPAEERHRPSTSTKLYCLVTEAHRCEQLDQGCYAALCWWESLYLLYFTLHFNWLLWPLIVIADTDKQTDRQMALYIDS